VDLDNIEAIRGWPTRNFLEVISFMGLAKYYKRFMEGFSNIDHPITYLQKKRIKFEWTTNGEDNFNFK
jgi:hypothetical protein